MDGVLVKKLSLWEKGGIPRISDVSPTEQSFPAPHHVVPLKVQEFSLVSCNVKLVFDVCLPLSKAYEDSLSCSIEGIASKTVFACFRVSDICAEITGKLSLHWGKCDPRQLARRMVLK